MNNNKYILDMKSRKDSNDAMFKPKNDIAKVLNGSVAKFENQTRPL
ncbi:hypothetical protein HZR21_10630 [Lactococcus laudensis]|uniref:Uncharacterized protein n=1 Tax=Pseudolactococcus laudensis TaxID=1494461 RepID=A0A7V8N2P2_9LACT|nr:hypothetical protein [Lactococcus laudensis]MBA0017546.1 hypothetical protein [Lactococcus laudensis]